MAKRILVVDDDEMVLIALNELLSPKGYEVETVAGGKEALERLADHSYDLLMLDVIMPEMDGFELCKRVRQIKEYSKTPIVFLTAKSAEEDKVRGLEAGANLFLSKPISPEKLLSIIAEALGSG
ncbi:MAG: response regulator [Deltaproteobacteria bacterium]|nr:response regulator [Deltaproteobacteria bacterium]MBW1920813.1 response regulator [Deltaproteobacteria bacterium]MBW1936702.1 response regulator [Deltaproteobacteria bacterium]MBW1977767.1 response regulator [Deltaproteobacteria bacterium]MBW2045463.1 response regulator [Deltaproteobacteria bacterium]